MQSQFMLCDQLLKNAPLELGCIRQSNSEEKKNEIKATSNLTCHALAKKPNGILREAEVESVIYIFQPKDLSRACDMSKE